MTARHAILSSSTHHPISLSHTHTHTHTHTHKHTHTHTHTYTHTHTHTHTLSRERTQGVASLSRSRTAHMRQSTPDSGLEFHVEGLGIFKGAPCSLSSGALNPTRVFHTSERNSATHNKYHRYSSVNKGPTFALRRSTLDFCLGGQPRSNSPKARKTHLQGGRSLREDRRQTRCRLQRQARHGP